MLKEYKMTPSQYAEWGVFARKASRGYKDELIKFWENLSRIDNFYPGTVTCFLLNKSYVYFMAEPIEELESLRCHFCKNLVSDVYRIVLKQEVKRFFRIERPYTTACSLCYHNAKKLNLLEED